MRETHTYASLEEKLGADENTQSVMTGRGQIWGVREGKYVNTPLCTRGLRSEINKKL